MKLSSVLTFFSLVFVILSLFVSSLLPSLFSRVLIFFIFSVFIILISWFTVTKRLNSVLLFVFILLPICSFLLVFLPLLDVYIEGFGFGELEFLAEGYFSQKVYDFSSSHASFFCTPMLVAFISSILGTSTLVAKFIVVFVYYSLMGIVGFYFLKIISRRLNSKIILILAAGFAFLISTNLINRP